MCLHFRKASSCQSSTYPCPQEVEILITPQNSWLVIAYAQNTWSLGWAPFVELQNWIVGPSSVEQKIPFQLMMFCPRVDLFFRSEKPNVGRPLLRRPGWLAMDKLLFRASRTRYFHVAALLFLLRRNGKPNKQGCALYLQKTDLISPSHVKKTSA